MTLNALLFRVMTVFLRIIIIRVFGCLDAFHPHALWRPTALEPTGLGFSAHPVCCVLLVLVVCIQPAFACLIPLHVLLQQLQQLILVQRL
jgi:hypothetical protein